MPKKVSSKKQKSMEQTLWDIREKIKRYIVNSGDVCFAIVGHTIGMVLYIDDEFDNANLTENAARLTNISDNFDSKFLFYYFLSSKGQSDIESRTVGSAQGKLPLYNIKSMEVPTPPCPNKKPSPTSSAASTTKSNSTAK